MPVEQALRATMLLLVALDLVFVQLTGAAGLEWVGPLFVLTLAAPLLRPLNDRWAYRSAWNAAVLVVFARLALHFLDGSLDRVLEHGLLLAALCQVHLLNNLRAGQRPDLLFTNAFLIAIVAGYLSDGLGFALGFLVFAPCYVVGLELLAAASSGGAGHPGVAPRLALDGVRRATWLLALSAAVFCFWPRDFERQAFFQGHFDLAPGAHEELTVGFSEELALDRRGPVEHSDVEVLRVVLVAGERADVPLLWRGATLAETSGGAWRVAPERGSEGAAADAPWRAVGGLLERSPTADARGVGPVDFPDGSPDGSPGGPRVGPRVEVLRHAQGSERLFLPLGALRVQLLEGTHRRLRPRPDGTVDVGGFDDARYALQLSGDPPAPLGGAQRSELPPELEPFVHLPVTDRIDRARALAARLAAQVAPEAPQHVLVAHLSEHLAKSYTYVPPGSTGAATSLASFLNGTRGGHCEFFASALATMLRSLGVPSRVVTGYRAAGWERSGDVLRFRARDGHAWVEVHDPSAGWYAVDPSPRRADAAVGPDLWARATAVGRAAWARVTGFDAEGRASALAWLGERPAAVARVARQHPAAMAGLALAGLAGLAGLGLLRRRAERTPAAARAYRAALRCAGIAPAPGETPREVLARAQSAHLSEARLAALEAATRRHEAERYAAS